MEYIVYRQEVCKLKGQTKIGDIDYYVLSPLSDASLSLKIPMDSAFLRPLLTKDEVENLIKKIKKISTLNLMEKNIETEYQKLLITSRPEDLITIVRTAYLRNKQREESGKKENDKDSYYLQKAESLLYAELAIVLNIDITEVKDYLLNKLSSN